MVNSHIALCSARHMTVAPPPGILDQGQGVLIVFEGSSADQTYTGSLDTIASVGKVVDSLYNKAKKLH